MTKIELRKDTRRTDATRGESYLLNAGGFDVYVDGVVWGRIIAESKGPLGILYTLHQVNGTGSRTCSKEVPSDTNPRFNHGKTTRSVYYTATSDKLYLLRLKSGVQPVPLPERLKGIARDALKDGALRDPAVIAAESKAAADKYRLSEAMALQEKNALWLKKAGDALGPYAHGMAAPVVADLKARIVDAMKWAQSQ